jgi:beta-phosphoglucomutase-like phosphatase (HAD superfamily)
MGQGPAFLFDLDGTLVDSVYQHVLAWQDALDRMGIELAVWRIHRKIGMSGGLLTNALLHATGRAALVTPGCRRSTASGMAMASIRAEQVRRSQCASCSASDAVIALAGRAAHQERQPLRSWGSRTTPVHAHRVALPLDHLFLAAAGGWRHIGRAVVVSDSVWDLLASRPPAQRASDCSQAVRPGGARRAGAYRVYEEPALSSTSGVASSGPDGVK